MFDSAPPGVTSCSSSPVVVSSVDYSGTYPAAQALTDDECDGSTVGGGQNYWLSPNHGSGWHGAYFELDLGCVRIVEAVKMRNINHRDGNRFVDLLFFYYTTLRTYTRYVASGLLFRATESFRLFGQLSRFPGTWQLLITDTLPTSLVCSDIPYVIFRLEKAVTIRYLRFVVVTYRVNGGGLQYLQVLP